MTQMELSWVPRSWANGPDFWSLTPQGAIYSTEDQLAVISDLHLGYEQTRAGAGDYLPQTSLIAIQKRLRQLFADVKVRQLVVAGDVMESGVAVRGSNSLVAQFVSWIKEQGVEPILLSGNHDVDSKWITAKTYEVRGWLILHGDSQSSYEKRVPGIRGLISGHIHPGFLSGGRNYRVFLCQDDRIILPAFTDDAKGCNVLSDRSFTEAYWNSFDCLVASSSEVLHFGKLKNLRDQYAQS